MSSTPTSVHSTTSITNMNYGSRVLHHGEIQTAGGVFRKKSAYFVLTESHLVRFKGKDKASELFPSIPASLGRTSTNRHSRMSSSNSWQELQSTATGETPFGIHLNDIVSVWRPEDAKPYFSIQIDYLDEEMNHSGLLTLQLHDPFEADLWTSSIRTAITNVRLSKPLPYSQGLIEYACAALEAQGDYDPSKFAMFKVIQRTGRPGANASSEDLKSNASTVSMLAIGLFKVHIVPYPRHSRTTSSTSLSDIKVISCALMNLTQLHLHDRDDAFSLTFRLPLHQSETLYLASSLVRDIALNIRHAADFLRPLWLEAPFTWNVPQNLEDEIWEIPPMEHEQDQAFHRTLCAYCAAYDVDPSRIRYAVHEDCEDAPAFELLSASDASRPRYSYLELLAIMRALRYNETFTTMSFRHISLNSLYNLRDKHGVDHVPWSTKSGEPMNIEGQENAPLLVQEVRALAVKSRRLRRLDFGYSVTDTGTNDAESQDPGCGICEALFPMCAKQYTNVDWVVLNGIQLTDVDVDYIFSAALDKSCHLRAIDVGYCGLRDHEMQHLLQSFVHQGATLESIDLSGNSARHNPNAINEYFEQLSFVRRLNMSNIIQETGSQSLFTAQTLCNWKLVELRLTRTVLSEGTINILAYYLSNSHSELLRILELDRCGLNGKAASVLLTALSKGYENPRDLHLDLSENRLESGHDDLVAAVARSCTPRRLTMQMMEYKDEKNFQMLVEAIANNMTTQILDISKLSLPSDAGDDTCEILHRLFTQNKVLEDVNISGEHTHIDTAQYGNGLNHALSGLKHNKTLKVLRVEHQKLGLRGISTLTSVLESNDTLLELHCENNEISLQAFTILVNSIAKNHTLLYLPTMDMDRSWAEKKVDREIQNALEVPRSPSSPISYGAVAGTVAGMASSTKGTVNRTLGRTIGRTIGSQKNFSPRGKDKRTSLIGAFNDLDFKDARGGLSQGWDREVARLREYLARNLNLARGLPADVHHSSEAQQPTASDNLRTAFQGVGIGDRTPIAEHDRQLLLDTNGEEGNVGGISPPDLESGEDEGDGVLEMSPHA